MEVPLQVAQDHEIQQSIVVQIDPSRTGGPAVASDSSFVSNVGERPVTVVVIKLVAGIRGHVQIFEAVIVVIADCHSHAVTRACQTGSLSYIFETSIALLVIEPVPVLRPGLLGHATRRRGIGERGAIDEKDIKQAIVVVIE